MKGVQDVKENIVTLAAIGVLASAPVLAIQQNIYQRPTVANATIIGSKNLFDGTYVTKGNARLCGELPPLDPLPSSGFVIEFEGQSPTNVAAVLDISFGSKELVGGVTKTSLFLLNVSVRTAKGGEPPAYVLHTQDKKPGNSGVATITRKGNTVTLDLRGTNDFGQSITLIVSCG